MFVPFCIGDILSMLLLVLMSKTNCLFMKENVLIGPMRGHIHIYITCMWTHLIFGLKYIKNRGSGMAVSSSILASVLPKCSVARSVNVFHSTVAAGCWFVWQRGVWKINQKKQLKPTERLYANVRFVYGHWWKDHKRDCTSIDPFLANLLSRSNPFCCKPLHFPKGNYTYFLFL